MYLFSVKDVKSGIYAPPFLSETPEAAVRNLQTSLFNSQDNLAILYPDDFILYQVGNFDNESGQVEGCDLVRLACCSELMPKYNEDEDGNVVKINPRTGKKSK